MRRGGEGGSSVLCGAMWLSLALGTLKKYLARQLKIHVNICVTNTAAKKVTKSIWSLFVIIEKSDQIDLVSMIFTNSYLDPCQIDLKVHSIDVHPRSIIDDLAPALVIETVESSFLITRTHTRVWNVHNTTTTPLPSLHFCPAMPPKTGGGGLRSKGGSNSGRRRGD